jgi:hypothetical protein
MIAWLAGTVTRPPTGFVFEDLDNSGNPPMLRMILMQVIFGGLGSITKLTTRAKCIIIGLVCFGLMYKDYYNFLKGRNANLYQAIGTHRAASTFEIEHILDMYKVCEHEFHESPCKEFDRKIYKYNTTEIEEIRYVLVKKPNLRELYDK